MMDTFSIPLRVYIEDTDAGGIVYYVNHLKFFERARTELFRQWGYAKPAFVEADRMLVVYALETRYIKPARLDDLLTVSANILSRKRASMVFEQRIYKADELLAEAKVTIACVYKDSMKPAPLAADILKTIDYNTQGTKSTNRV